MQNTSEFWLFPPVFHFSLSILTFLREKWRFFTFSKGKCKIPRYFEFSLWFFTFSSVFWRENWKDFGGKSENPEGKVKIPGYFPFSLVKSKKPPLFPRKLKKPREKSKFRGILHFPSEKVKKWVFVYLHWCEENEMVFVSHEVSFPATSDWRSWVAGNGTEWEVKTIELSSTTSGGEQWAFLNFVILTAVKKTVPKLRKSTLFS